MVETSSDQLPQQDLDKQNISRISHRFYRQVTYDKNYKHIYLQMTMHESK